MLNLFKKIVYKGIETYENKNNILDESFTKWKIDAKTIELRNKIKIESILKKRIIKGGIFLNLLLNNKFSTYKNNIIFIFYIMMIFLKIFFNFIFIYYFQ